MPAKVLIADDDQVSCRLLRALLEKWGYEVTVASNGLEAQAELRRSGAARLAILDWMMPGLDGLGVIRELRAEKSIYTYVLLLTSKGEKTDILQGLDAGADDYLTKPFDSQQLRARLRVGERIIDLQQRLISALETSEFQASHDFLTGVYNRAATMEALKREMAKSQREANSLAVFLIDADHFKSINDRHGHLVGDEVLRQLCSRIKSGLRPYDVLGRYGGEEFLVLAPNCDSDNAAVIAERIRACVAKEALDVGHLKVELTVSIGATTSCGTMSDLTSLLRAADRALYDAKEGGRNRSILAQLRSQAQSAR
jgi:two-component system, cell cycle response regulator